MTDDFWAHMLVLACVCACVYVCACAHRCMHLTVCLRDCIAERERERDKEENNMLKITLWAGELCVWVTPFCEIFRVPSVIQYGLHHSSLSWSFVDVIPHNIMMNGTRVIVVIRSRSFFRKRKQTFIDYSDLTTKRSISLFLTLSER